jgi:DNA topoisomerase-3
MRLFIAEKPSLARAIAEALPGPRQKRDGYIECGGDNLVAWCAGHILEQAPPDEYDPKFKTWSLDHLPITPQQWKLVVKTPELLKTIGSLLPKATRVVNAGDPDREGQLLVDEVLEFLHYKGPVDRVLISDLNTSAVIKAIAGIQSNANFRKLYESALARQRADWLYGMNMTRLYTLLGRGGGYGGVLSVGRVQTPLLGLVVRRDLEIERFQSKPYYTLTAAVASPSGPFVATWQPGASVEGALDTDGRLISREKAAEFQRQTSGRAGVVSKSTFEKKAEAAPLPYSLADLQVDAAKQLGVSAKDVLDVAQSLYETHRLITYPRSDCSFLPEGHLEQARSVTAAIETNLPSLRAFASSADLSLRSRAWNDKKVTAHHAIIPTPTARPDARLSDRERAVYELVARRYRAQFFPAFEYNQTQLEVTVAGERFTASGRQGLAQGWRVLLAAAADDAPESDADPVEANRSLPMLKEGQTVTVGEVAVAEKKTQPPKRFTHATLVQAMTGIARFVENPSIKQILRETDGIGTPATQAAIIDTLFERNYLEEKKKQIVSTPTGRVLIQTLPSIATTPDMTALWESAMRRISEGEMPFDDFLARVLGQLRDLIARGKASGAVKMPGGRHFQARNPIGDDPWHAKAGRPHRKRPRRSP